MVVNYGGVVVANVYFENNSISSFLKKIFEKYLKIKILVSDFF